MNTELQALQTQFDTFIKDTNNYTNMLTNQLKSQLLRIRHLEEQLKPEPSPANYKTTALPLLAKGYTQVKVASICNVSLSSIKRLCANDEAKAKIAELKRLSNIK